MKPFLVTVFLLFQSSSLGYMINTDTKLYCEFYVLCFHLIACISLHCFIRAYSLTLSITVILRLPLFLPSPRFLFIMLLVWQFLFNICPNHYNLFVIHFNHFLFSSTFLITVIYFNHICVCYIARFPSRSTFQNFSDNLPPYIEWSMFLLHT